jgi:hypothetical protein
LRARLRFISVFHFVFATRSIVTLLEMVVIPVARSLSEIEVL